MYKIVEKLNHLATHAIGFYGEKGKEKAQGLIDEGYYKRFYPDTEMEVIEDK